MKDTVFGGQVVALDLNAESKEAAEFAYRQHECVLRVSPQSAREGGVC